MSAVLPHLEITPRRPDWLAGAPGFEPGNGGIKIRCLTTWLRPKERRTILAQARQINRQTTGCDLGAVLEICPWAASIWTEDSCRGFTSSQAISSVGMV